MVNLRFKIGTCAIWLLLAASVANGKEWRGIVPLKSTRADVERLLGVSKRSSDLISYYRLPKEIVVFHFQNELCGSQIGKFGFGWNVPLGTVTNIAVIPRGTHRLDEYKSTNNFEVDDNGAGFVYYTERSAGLTIETYKNLVTLVEYEPEATQEHLRCPRLTECCIDFFYKFDEYTTIPFEDEQARLDNFMIHLEAGFWRGTIQVLGPSRKERQQRLKLAARAKRYLVRVRGLEPERLLLVDGGYDEISLTRLAAHSIGGVATRINLFPRNDPKTTPASRPATRRKPRS